jgi:hypothetical protein
MTQINVKLVEIYAGILTSSSMVIIEVFKDEENDTRYYSYTEDHEHNRIHTQVYMCPDVNPIVYKMIDYIKKCGITRILDNGDVVGPHLTRKRNHNENGYLLYQINQNEEPSILKTDIVPATTLIDDQEWFEQLVKL